MLYYHFQARIRVVFKGNGNGTFQVGSKYQTGGSKPNTMEHGDFNNDGKLDVIVGHANSPASLAILLNDGVGGFLSPNVSPVVALAGAFVSAVFDVNSDGFLDAIQSALFGSERVYKGDGSGGILGIQVINGGPDVHTSHCVADFNQDGFNDIAGCGDGSPMTISAGAAGIAAFTNYQTFVIGNGVMTYPQHIIDCDLNGDGAKDIVVAETFGNRVVVFLNNIPTQIPVIESKGSLLVYPNPARERLFFSESNTATKQLTNFAGQLIVSTKGPVMDIQNLSKGLYLLRCGKHSRTILIE